tara:strand:+ start:396 stop:938 length:543 start_codon:yes stop_codon:yes gene_type:complete
MIEVESKIKISNPSEFRKKLSKLYKFKSRQKKIDDYYTLGGRENYAKRSLRVRHTGKGIYVVNFKQRISYLSGVHAKNEEEFQVTDIQHFIDLIKDFGFKKWLTKEKHSEIYRIRKDLTIELNQVKSLGWFAEIEYLVPNKSQIPKARKVILDVMKQLDIPKKDVIESGYTKMLWALKHK